MNRTIRKYLLAFSQHKETAFIYQTKSNNPPAYSAFVLYFLIKDNSLTLRINHKLEELFLVVFGEIEEKEDAVLWSFSPHNHHVRLFVLHRLVFFSLKRKK